MAFVQELQADFKRLVDNDDLVHGYVFFGINFKKQYTFAKELANYIEQKKWQAPERILPDSLFINEDKPGIGIARTVTKFLWQKPFNSSKKILIINKAHGLTAQGQNAILKISEEPPEHSLIILIVRDPDVLITPLNSRLQKIYFSGEGEAEFSDKAKMSVSQVLRAPTRKERTDAIKQMLEDEIDLDEFISALIFELRKNLMRNWVIIKEVLNRWVLINQFNVNKKLQLEAVFSKLD